MSPSAQLPVTSVMSGISIASEHPTIAGIPNSLAIIAAWDVLPPFLVMISADFFMSGSQSGVVISVTSTSPC